jgi:TonB family protein
MRQIMVSLAVTAAACAAAGCVTTDATSPSSHPKLDSANVRHMVQALKQQLHPCWQRPPGVTGAGADAPRAVVRFTLNPDGSLASEPVVVGSYRDPSRVVAKAALAAVKRCQPFRLPPNLYQFWQDVEANMVADDPT